MAMPEKPKEPNLQNKSHFREWIENNTRLIRIGILLLALLLYFLVLPAPIRIIFESAFRNSRILTIMLVIFSLLMVSLIWSAGQELDKLVFLYINFHGKRPMWLDRLMLGFTQLGNGLTSVILAVVVYWKNPILTYEILLGTITLWLVVEFLKFLVRRSRPFIRITETRIVGLRARGRSFPSGHTSQAFFAATLFIQYFEVNVWIAILLYAAALLVGITRMYIGAHYPRDVLAGAVLGTVWGLLGTVIESYWQLGVG